MNSVILIGRLTKDPEIRYTTSDEPVAIATFNLAVDRPVRQGMEKQADFPRITVWGRQAENCEKYLTKGRLVGIQGRIQTGSYKNKDGDTVYTTDVRADRVEFLQWGDQNNQQAASQSYHNGHQGQYSTQAAPQNNYQSQMTMPPEGFAQLEDEDIPF